MDNHQGGSRTGDALRAYKYTTRISQNKIRLVELVHGQFHDPIQVRIYEEEFKDPLPPYTALSYTWGDPNHKVSIQLYERNFHDETVHSVTRNLSVALRYLRDGSNTKTYWIDALCINQVDNTEKADQVSMMTEIYRKASEVKIWLGRMADDSDEAMERLEKGSDIDISIGSEQHLRARRSLEAFFLRDYWTRAWVVQEIIVNACLKIKCGEKEVDWNIAVEALNKYLDDRDQELKRPKLTKISSRGRGLNTRPMNTIKRLNSYRGGNKKAMQTITTIGYLDSAREGNEKEEEEQGRRTPGWLLHMVLSIRHFGATNPRDKIFSLLGLNPDGPPPFPPDYNLSFFDVSINFFNYCVEDLQRDSTSTDDAPGPLDIICASQPDTEHNFPTWLPDFSRDNAMEQWLPQKELSKLGTLKAKPTLSPNNRILSVCTVRVAKIHRTTDSRDDCFAVDDWSLLARLENFKKLVSDSNFGEDFWSSLVLGEEVGKEVAKEAAKEASKEIAKKASKETAKKAPRETAKKAPRETAKKASKETAKKAAKGARNRHRENPSNANAFNLIKDNIGERSTTTHNTTVGYRFLNEFRRKSWGRRFAIFRNSKNEDRNGMVPEGAQEGDEVYCLKGCNYLILLRRLVPGVKVSSFHFVGPCYVFEPHDSWTDVENRNEESVLIH